MSMRDDNHLPHSAGGVVDVSGALEGTDRVGRVSSAPDGDGPGIPDGGLAANSCNHCVHI